MNDTAEREPQPVETSLGYRFRDPSLLRLALTHRSYRFEHPQETGDNQRLEFLGDAVLQLLVAEWAYRRLQNQPEGALTILRSRLVSTTALAAAARELGLGAHLRLGRGEAADGGAERDALLADVLEAVIAAVYLDAGLARARTVLKRVLGPRLDLLDVDPWSDNPKGRLQQLAQQRMGAQPSYRTLDQDGPPHRRHFRVEVVIESDPAAGTVWRADGTGPSKQAAQVAAARAMLARIEAVDEP